MSVAGGADGAARSKESDDGTSWEHEVENRKFQRIHFMMDVSASINIECVSLRRGSWTLYVVSIASMLVSNSKSIGVVSAGRWTLLSCARVAAELRRA